MSAAASLKLGPAELNLLRSGAFDLGVSLDAEALERFAAYAASLDRWRTTTNLISCRTAEEFVARHLLDSLAPAWIAGGAQAVADLGSGAGLPGVPLAIVAPLRRTVLVESRQRRVSFLRDVIRSLELQNVEVHARRAENVDPGQTLSVDVAVSRAVWSADDILPVAGRWVRDGGVVMCMRAEGHVPPKVDEKSAWIVEGRLTYRVATERPRRIDVYRKRADRGSVSRGTSS